MERRSSARRWGLTLAMGMRVLLLLSISWIMSLTRPLVSVAGLDVSGRALILVGGGLFLLAKSTREIHHRLEDKGNNTSGGIAVSFSSVLLQIVLLDVIFSLDSVITAVGMVDEIPVMVAAVIIAVTVMMIFAGAISDFIERHPTVKMLALSFLLLVGMALLAEGLDIHIPKGYIYFAMFFSMSVEILNIRASGKKKPAG